MNRFIIKLIHFSCLGTILLSILIVFYIVLDPFKVIYKYDTYYENQVKGRVDINKDYVSTSTFNNNRKNSHINYNSFIFGNSNSIFFQLSDWQKHLPAGSNCYHFDAAAESLWAINKKIEYIDRQEVKIENVLLILDYQTLIKDKSQKGHLFIISPALVNYKNIAEFHITFIKSFLTHEFLFTYFDFLLSGEIKPYMKNNRLLNDRVINYDSKTNEIRLDYLEDLINENKYYISERMEVFYERDLVENYSPMCIKENQEKLLNNVNEIFKKNRTNFKIIINPLYDQIRFNQNDLQYLKDLFGDNNVFDFSGKNKITNDYTNYYEASHYRPVIAREIMNEIYKKE